MGRPDLPAPLPLDPRLHRRRRARPGLVAHLRLAPAREQRQQLFRGCAQRPADDGGLRSHRQHDRVPLDEPDRPGAHARGQPAVVDLDPAPGRRRNPPLRCGRPPDGDALGRPAAAQPDAGLLHGGRIQAGPMHGRRPAAHGHEYARAQTHVRLPIHPRKRPVRPGPARLRDLRRRRAGRLRLRRPGPARLAELPAGRSGQRRAHLPLQRARPPLQRRRRLALTGLHLHELPVSPHRHHRRERGPLRRLHPTTTTAG